MTGIIHKTSLRFSCLSAIAVMLMFSLSACEGPDTTITAPAPERVRLGNDQNYVDFGDYVVHVNALTTSQLTPEIAAAYDIVRSDKSAMLNVVAMEKQASGSDMPVEATVSVAAANLTGQLKSMDMREVRDGENIYYIGEVAIANQETLMFEIDVRPLGSDADLLFSYNRKFYVD